MLAKVWAKGLLGRKLVANAGFSALAVAFAAPAFASGAGANALLANFSGLGRANGIYFSTYAPNPDVGAGVRSLTHARLYFSLGSVHYNGVGFITADSRSNRRLAYQISDQNGAFTYYVSNYTYQPYDAYGSRNVMHAGVWQSSGNTWHFNWWGPNLNVGVDAYNAAAGSGPDATSVGADGWGGCPNAYPVNYAWDYMYRNRDNGYWYYMPSTNNYSWGNTPTWSIFGSASWGSSINFGTTSCP